MLDDSGRLFACIDACEFADLIQGSERDFMFISLAGAGILYNPDRSPPRSLSAEIFRVRASSATEFISAASSATLKFCAAQIRARVRVIGLQNSVGPGFGPCEQIKDSAPLKESKG